MWVYLHQEHKKVYRSLVAFKIHPVNRKSSPCFFQQKIVAQEVKEIEKSSKQHSEKLFCFTLSELKNNSMIITSQNSEQ